MINSKKMSRSIELMFFKSILLILFFSFQSKASEMINEKYLFEFKTYKSTCDLRVNDLSAANNVKASLGTMSAGFNSTAFLSNGNNTIELLMGPQIYKDPKTLYPDSSCEVTVSKDTKDKSTKIASFKLSVNEKGEITAKNSLNYNGSQFNSQIFEGYTKNQKDYGMYKLSSNLIVHDLPRWEWTKGTPVTERDLPMIRKAYENIWWMMYNRDIDGLKKISQISTQEMAYAEGTTTGIMFVSTDFPEHVLNKSLTPVPIDWSQYKLITYKNGYLFRMGVGYYQNSPLKFKDSTGTAVFGYAPYFSIINGQITLVR
ncbi:hypothetical protein [Enterobacter ludwigii]|uniref:hypothetical protein n=1 Tax=Enterobacter ludwigii TaxID=299767 RepID=UPI000643300D|nr:hypothetical protein [Enterobacter ludwigii]KLP46344.1 IdsF [Enterobacter ludwigii]